MVVAIEHESGVTLQFTYQHDESASIVRILVDGHGGDQLRFTR